MVKDRHANLNEIRIFFVNQFKITDKKRALYENAKLYQNQLNFVVWEW